MGFHKSQVIPLSSRIIKAFWGRKLPSCSCVNPSLLTTANATLCVSLSPQARFAHWKGIPRSVPQRQKAPGHANKGISVFAGLLGVRLMVWLHPDHTQAWRADRAQSRSDKPECLEKAIGSLFLCAGSTSSDLKNTGHPPFPIFPKWISFKPSSSSAWYSLDSDRWFWLVTEDCPGKTVCLSREFSHWWAERGRPL